MMRSTYSPSARHRKSLMLVVGATLTAWAWVLGAPLAGQSGWSQLAALLYASLSPICHQLPERSLAWGGFPLALCARCTGLLLGFTAGLLPQVLNLGEATRALRVRVLLLAAGSLLLIDVLAPLLGVYENTPASRVATGSLFGLAMAPHIVPGVADLLRILGNQRKGASSYEWK